jgi:hypothetical protein
MLRTTPANRRFWDTWPGFQALIDVFRDIFDCDAGQALPPKWRCFETIMKGSNDFVKERLEREAGRKKKPELCPTS